MKIELLRPVEPERLTLEGKRVAVFGVGTSGLAAARLLLAQGARVHLLDSNATDKQIDATGDLARQGVHTILGLDSESDRSDYDLGIISPGIDETSKIIANFSANNPEAPLLGELELGYRFCNVPIIGITGTNGKTTTTELLNHVLNACGVKSTVAGNIGRPLSEVVLQDADLGLQIITCEISSFQLETIGYFRPRVAVWLNFSADHLDRYRSLEEYRRAKLRMFENQTQEDFAIVNARDKLPSLEAQITTFSATDTSADYTLHRGIITRGSRQLMDLSGALLQGLHNAENMMTALAVAELLELDLDKAVGALCDYTPPEHRMEFVAAVEGVRYINDTKSTNPDSLEKALMSQEKPVVLIAGGKRKGHDFVAIRETVACKVKKAVLIGELKEDIRRQWENDVECVLCESMQEAVQVAHDAALPGEVVLLSPGSSSFDMYSGYAERGEDFRNCVKRFQPGGADANPDGPAFAASPSPSTATPAPSETS